MPDPITVESIVRKALVDMGADGLCHTECGCGLDDLAPCGELGSACRPAWKSVCPQCGGPSYWPTKSDEPRTCGWCRESNHA